MVGHQSEGVHDQHHVVVGVYYLLERLTEVDPLDAHNQDGPHVSVAAVGVESPPPQFGQRRPVELGDNRVPVVFDHILDALDDLFCVELGHVGVFEDQFVPDSALVHHHFL